MPDAYSTRSHAHTQYRLADGTRVPSVTTILGIVAKPALIAWANRLGLQGIDSSKYVDERAEQGTCAHALIEAHLKGSLAETGRFSADTLAAAEVAYQKWLAWEREADLGEIDGSELPLVSEAMRVGGTCDLHAMVGRLSTVVDIKTSGSGIYPEHQTQAAVYAAMLEELGRRVDRVLIVRCSTVEGDGTEVREVLMRTERVELFRHLRAVYEIQQKLGK